MKQKDGNLGFATLWNITLILALDNMSQQFYMREK